MLQHVFTAWSLCAGTVLGGERSGQEEAVSRSQHSEAHTMYMCVCVYMEGQCNTRSDAQHTAPCLPHSRTHLRVLLNASATVHLLSPSLAQTRANRVSAPPGHPPTAMDGNQRTPSACFSPGDPTSHWRPVPQQAPISVAHRKLLLTHLALASFIALSYPLSYQAFMDSLSQND